MNRLPFLIALAALAALPRPCRAQNAAAPTAEASVVALTARVAPNRDLLWVLDRETHRLAVYRVDNNGLTAVAVREIVYDFHPYEYSNAEKGEGRQFPSVMEMNRSANKALAGPGAGKARPPASMPVGTLLMTKGSIETDREVVYVLDGSNRKLAVYASDGKSLSLLYVRDLQADLKAVEYSSNGAQSPSVQDVKKLVDKAISRAIQDLSGKVGDKPDKDEKKDSKGADKPERDEKKETKGPEPG